MFKAKVTCEWHGEKVPPAVEKEVGLTIQKACLDLKRRSSMTAPKLTGDLRGNCSAVFDRTVISPPGNGATVPAPTQSLTGRVGYSLPYALVQHEELGYKHPMGGKAKYLEDPTNQMQATYKKAIAKAAGKGAGK
jgi:hypothetical protein